MQLNSGLECDGRVGNWWGFWCHQAIAMNIRTTGRLLVLFFTRPIRLADFAFLPGFLLAMARSAKRPQEARVAGKPDFEPTRVMSSRSGEAFDAWGRSKEVAVSEEALDTTVLRRNSIRPAFVIEAAPYRPGT